MLSWFSKLFAPGLSLPEKWQGRSWSDIDFLAIDLELTSLDTQEANILSIGWVGGKASQIALNQCHYQVIHSNAPLNQSPTIHGLVDKDIQQGSPVSEAVESLLTYANSHVWVFHCADLDMAVLQKVMAKLALPLPTLVVVDTLRFSLYQLAKEQLIPSPNAATLASCRQRFNLPLAPAHNALDDAMATLELLFAQLNDFDPTATEPLQHLTITKALSLFEASETR